MQGDYFSRFVKKYTFKQSLKGFFSCTTEPLPIVDPLAQRYGSESQRARIVDQPIRINILYGVNQYTNMEFFPKKLGKVKQPSERKDNPQRSQLIM